MTKDTGCFARELVEELLEVAWAEAQRELGLAIAGVARLARDTGRSFVAGTVVMSGTTATRSKS